MNNNSNFIRKISYILGIGVLLIPLSMVSLPATRNAENEVDRTGGKLAQLRDEFELSQAQLMEIDPASETMKLASLGLRGVAVNMLWMQAIEHKKKENYEQLASTLKALTKIQPNFVKVWEFQGHNLSYNISMEFDDYEYRYHWVKKGIEFLRDGIPYNRQDHRMLDNLGFFTGLKIGRSDEKNQFRRMFRKDTTFHNAMADYIEPDLYDTREYEYDNWKMAYYWYDLSRELVAKGAQPYISDSRFYSHQPAQLRNQGASLGKEFRTDEIIQDVWRGAFDEWQAYGNMEIRNTFGVNVQMESVGKYEEEKQELESQLDELGPPGLRAQYMAEIKRKINLSPREEAALAVPPSERNDMEFRIAEFAQKRIAKEDQGINLMILQQVDDADKRRAKDIYDKLQLIQVQINAVGLHDGVTNYRYWKTRNRCEADELCVIARQALYDAEEMRRRSVFDDEYEVDPETGEKKIVRRGAISLYEDAYTKFLNVLDEYAALRDGNLADDLVDSMQDYKKMIDMAGMEWPDDFPLQKLIDSRANVEELYDNLPTSAYLEERRADREEQEAMEAEEAEDDAMDDEGEDNASDDDTESESENTDGETDGDADAGKNDAGDNTEPDKQNSDGGNPDEQVSTK